LKRWGADLTAFSQQNAMIMVLIKKSQTVFHPRIDARRKMLHDLANHGFTLA
jgi:hypothetical protein